PVGIADLASEPFKRFGRFALRIFLVHPVEHRKIALLGVDQLDVVAPLAQPLDHILGEPDTHPVGAIGAVKDEDAVAHRLPSLMPGAPFRTSMALTESSNALSRTRLPMVPSTKPSARPLRFLPSRTTTTSMSVVPSRWRVKV